MTPETQQPTVEQLIRDFKCDPKARDALFQLVETWVRERVRNIGYGLLRRRIGDSAAVSEAWTQVFKSLETFKGTTGAELRHWVNTVVDNTLNDLLRHERAGLRNPDKEVRLDASPETGDGSGWQPSSPASTPSQRAMREEDEKRLAEAMGKLSVEHRQVIYLRHWDKLHFEEIGLRLNRSEDAAKKLHRRALLELRRIMKVGDQ